jgi:hypothetical protein
MTLFWIGFFCGLTLVALPVAVFLFFFGHMIFTPRDW